MLIHLQWPLSLLLHLFFVFDFPCFITSCIEYCAEGRASNRRRRRVETENKLETSSETDSIKATLVLHEDLKQLSEIIHTIEGNCPNITGSVNVLDLFISSKNHIEYGRKKAGRGVMMLKEGLSILYEAQELLKVTDSKPQE